MMNSQLSMIDTQSQIQIRNTLLEKLSVEERNSLFPGMELTEFSPKETVYSPRQSLAHAYFPETCVMSLITVLEDGSEIEAATIGNEGMIGIPLLLAGDQMPSKVVCQIGGSAWRIPADELIKAVEKDAVLFLNLRRYAQALFDLLAQSTACNRLHTIEQRCARWLLSTHDRIEGDTFFLTHEFLATMLGVRRPGVSLVAKSLQDSGFVSYKHGKMTIRDRNGLEGISCECYAAVRESYGRLN
ncbi:MAG: Crp/Fnr family transcriptional regulator [Candidatus Melainabacteria bacterium]|nr:MAG: Crp/Fnr family transcriptional regulator [Candidatus Melainabacteria bacterium]